MQLIFMEECLLVGLFKQGVLLMLMQIILLIQTQVHQVVKMQVIQTTTLL